MEVPSTAQKSSANAPAATSVVGAVTAGTRALASQLFTFYIRIPVKLFRPTRIDYLALPRAIHPTYQIKPWNIFTHSGPALIAHAVKEHGWQFIPNNILPPLVANSAVGLALYTSYLTSLAILKDDKGGYGMKQSLIAGGVAGGVQSLAAAPIDAIVTRFNAQDVLESNHKSLWRYSAEKLREIGASGVFAGYSLSFLKESLGFAAFFATFEVVKGPWYNKFVKLVYGDQSQPNHQHPGRAVFPSFVLLAGGLSTFALQLVHYPLGKVQRLHFITLEMLYQKHHAPRPLKQGEYIEAYIKTFRKINKLRLRDAKGSWFRWLFGGFFKSTLMAVPSTSIGLVVFEIMRLRYDDGEKPAFTYDEHFYDD
ncbi:hypothetical protein TRVA0_055S00738 [Trichomonascus vanleenenianus]|uniref:uncharacterized protein n=1 Tax=Trichomonascus vanleenenianus TaxID=2268995 RepID=UPI003EC9A6AA